MNTTPKGSAGIALLLLGAARAVRKTEHQQRPSSRSILLRRSVGRVAASYPSRISGWGQAA